MNEQAMHLPRISYIVGLDQFEKQCKTHYIVILKKYKS